MRTSKKALANLPKTLYEKYDKIFLTIPDENRLFVYHTLQWVQIHNGLYVDNENFPCSVLLEAVGKSTAALIANQNDCFYDQETLRELCGCLIYITPQHPRKLTVSFAHYTVQEYLGSGRISNHLTAYTNDCESGLYNYFLELILLEAHAVEPIEQVKEERNSIDTRGSVHAVEYDFNDYCVVSAILMIVARAGEISEHNTLCTLAIDLLDSSKPHFQILRATARRIESYIGPFPRNDFYENSQFWKLKWHPHLIDDEAVHLLNILLTTVKSRFEWDFLENKSLGLAKKFLQGKHSYDFFQTRLNVVSREWAVNRYNDLNDHIFDGSIIEIYAQLGCGHSEPLNLLLEYGTGLFDPSRILLLSIGYHGHEHYGEFCIVKRLLQLGADPNITEYLVTPLQIAVSGLDPKGVDLLLKAGADPNDTSNTEGIIWGEKEPMNRFNNLHSASPLYICRSDNPAWYNATKKTKKDREEIEAILLRYAANNIYSISCSPP